MTRQKFKNLLVQAMEEQYAWEPDVVIEDFLTLNYNKDSVLADWEYEKFVSLAKDICKYGFWEACKLNNFECPEEQEY